MDEIDVKILDLLQANARSTASDIGGSIGMSVSAVIERMKKLEHSGVVEKYTAVINHKVVKKDIMAFVNISLDRPKYSELFLDFVRNCDDILECHYLAGDYDYLIKVITDSTSTLERLLREIKCIDGVIRTCTSMVLNTEKTLYSVTPESIPDTVKI